uniref:Uncharacterized protein n=1 Tax=Corvus moneduloides TaxID=1196302 RepID=A0A8U7NZC9_CORMO
MSSHETIRVLEVGVDGDPKTAGEGAGGSPGQGGPPGVEDAPSSTPSSSGGEAAGERPPPSFPGWFPAVPRVRPSRDGSLQCPGSVLPGIVPFSAPGPSFPGSFPSVPRVRPSRDGSRPCPGSVLPGIVPSSIPGSGGGDWVVSPGLLRGPAAAPPPPAPRERTFWGDPTFFLAGFWPAPQIHPHVSPVPPSPLPGGGGGPARGDGGWPPPRSHYG